MHVKTIFKKTSKDCYTGPKTYACKDAATWDLGTYPKMYCRSSQQVIEGRVQKSEQFKYAINMTFKHAIKSFTLSSFFHIIYTQNEKNLFYLNVFFSCSMDTKSFSSQPK